jgi:hypothetical protein
MALGIYRRCRLDKMSSTGSYGLGLNDCNMITEVRNRKVPLTSYPSHAHIHITYTYTYAYTYAYTYHTYHIYIHISHTCTYAQHMHSMHMHRTCLTCMHACT